MTRLTSLFGMLIVVAFPTAITAAEYRLHSRVGQCEYSFIPVKEQQWTKCAAEAYIIDVASSEIYRCSAEVEGDQYVAPSVAESAPEKIICTLLGKPFPQSGSYDMAITDDQAKAERTFSRRQGFFSWKNGFWVHSRDSLKVKFCAARLSAGGPDFRTYCSKDVEWRK
jgi:hypothetical protein